MKRASKVRHTPGPWFADGYKVFAHQETAYEGGASGPRFTYKVADACYHSAGSFEEQRANARLIAAAPELYAAAKEVESLLTTRADTREWGDEAHDAALVLRRALAIALVEEKKA